MLIESLIADFNGRIGVNLLLDCQSACKNDPVSAPNFDPLLSLHIERQLITFDA